MKLSVWFTMEAPPEFDVSPPRAYAEMLEYAQLADELGVHAAWVSEHHHLSNGYCPSPLIALAGIAGRTRRIRLGTGVLVLPLAGNSIKVAEDVAVLDAMSGGRVNLGIGAGYRALEFADLGASFDGRVSRTWAGIRAMKSAWAGEPREHQTATEVEAVVSYPAPAQNPHPPIWMGATTLESRRRAAGEGLHFISPPAAKLAKVRGTTAEFLEAPRPAAAQPPEVSLLREGYVGTSAELSWEQVSPYLMYCYRGVYGPQWSRFVEQMPDGSFRRITDPLDPYLESELFRADRFIIGDVEQCARDVAGYAAAGVTELIVRGIYPGQPLEQAAASLERLVTEVMPRSQVLASSLAPGARDERR